MAIRQVTRRQRAADNRAIWAAQWPDSRLTFPIHISIQMRPTGSRAARRIDHSYAARYKAATLVSGSVYVYECECVYVCVCVRVCFHVSYAG